jgi:hypothetical protein
VELTATLKLSLRKQLSRGEVVSAEAGGGVVLYATKLSF